MSSTSSSANSADTSQAAAEQPDDPQSSKPSSSFLPGFASADAFSDASLRQIAMATKLSNALPADSKDAWDYYTTFKGFRQVMSAENGRLIGLINKCLAFNGLSSKLSSGGGGVSVADAIDALTEANDAVLERVSTSLDEAEGIKKHVDQPLLLEVSKSGLSRISGSWNRPAAAAAGPSPSQAPAANAVAAAGGQVRLLAAKHVMRPQIKFKDKIDNSDKPFVPRLKDKPHAVKPLSILVEYAADGTEFFSHPYLFEIERLRLPASQLEADASASACASDASVSASDASVSACASVHEAGYEFIDSADALARLVRKLAAENAIAVDLEHHSYRSFLGLTSLIQISTASDDYLIDPFPLWHELTLLNEVFADPRVLKVFHGAGSDVLWLQRDFSVYVVNMFDTYEAAKLLGFPSGCHSLKFLLSHYCGVHTNKKYQLADWRIRPLHADMVKYAREDTRYLLYIYKRMKSELLESGNERGNLLLSAYGHSNDVCKRRYEKPRGRDGQGHLDLVRKWKTVFNSRQMFALSEMYAWRNGLGRSEDESENYVLPPHMLLKICTELPREMQGILACCSPVPPLVKQNLVALHQIVLSARGQPLTSAVADIEAPPSESQRLLSSLAAAAATDDPLRCPHDLSYAANEDAQAAESGARETLVRNGAGFFFCGAEVPVKKRPAVSVLAARGDERAGEKIKPFLSPYQRYQMLKPYLLTLAESDRGGVGSAGSHAGGGGGGAGPAANPWRSGGEAGDAAAAPEPSDDERMRSIQQHFAALTAMTPQEYVGDDDMSAAAAADDGKKRVEEEKSSEDNDEASGDLSAYQEAGKVVNFRKELTNARRDLQRERKRQMKSKDGKKKAKKQKSSESSPAVSSTVKRESAEAGSSIAKEEAAAEAGLASAAKGEAASEAGLVSAAAASAAAAQTREMDLDNADFSQFKRSEKEKSAVNSKIFDPWKDFKKKNMKGKQRQAQRCAKAGKSCTFGK